MAKTTIGMLRKIIAEEVRMLLEYEESIVRRGEKLYLINDEGEREYLGSVSSYPEYSHLADGESAPYTGGSRGSYEPSGGSRYKGQSSYYRRGGYY